MKPHLNTEARKSADYLVVITAHSIASQKRLTKMSGGKFDYLQSHLILIAEQIEYEIDHNSIPDDFGDANNFSEQTLSKFRETVNSLQHLYKMIHDIDYLLSGDIGEETFLNNWDKNYDYNSNR